MSPRRVGLYIPRAARRIRAASDNDMWVDPSGLLDLPRGKAEEDRLKDAVRRLRTRKAGPAREVMVPKRDGLTRPGHIISLVERVYFQALVDGFFHDADLKLESRSAIFGSRDKYGRASDRPFGRKRTEQWLEWRKAVKDAARSGAYDAAVNTDVAAYFERVDHARLRDHLQALGVRPDVATEVRDLLRDLMVDSRGLPQGSDPARVLSTMFLDPVDKEMLRAGYAYFRFMDDIYVFAATEPEVRKGLHQLEAAMRRIGLNLQPGKTRIIVGSRQMKSEIIDLDDEVDLVDYIIKRARSGGRRFVRRKWNSASRRKPFPQRLGKYLIGRLADNRDPLAVRWCLRRLAVLDWMSNVVGRYLSIFASRPEVQREILAHLISPMNLTAYSESNWLRACLSARKVNRPLLDYARKVVADKRRSIPSRQWAAVLLGRHGDASDHALIETHALDDADLARASITALQSLAIAPRTSAYKRISARYPDTSWLAERLKTLRAPRWPEF